MSGPTTAAELLHLAERQLHELTGALGTDRAPSAAGLAAGWPAFHRAGRQLIAALHPDQDGNATPAQQHRPSAAAIAAAVDDESSAPQLTRAAELLSAAADLIASRDRHGLPALDRKADLARASRPLFAGAYLIAQATLPDSALLEATVTAVTAARDWSTAQPSGYLDPQAGSLHDASTLPTAGSANAVTLPKQLNVAVARWQHTALAAAGQPTPSSEDLRGTAQATGALISLAQVLLRLHDGPAGPYQHEPARTIGFLQAAGKSWNTAASNWGTLRTSTPPDRELQAATADLRQAIRLLGRSGAQWATGQEIRGRADPAAALAAARGALSAVQLIADQHRPLVAELARTGGLYVPARQLSPSTDILQARFARKWLPATVTEHQPLTAAYQHLPGATTTARLAYTALTGPAGSQPRPHEQQQQDPPGQDLAENPVSAASSDPPPVSPPDLGAQTLASRRWQQAAHELDPRLLGDPHWLVLAGALDRVHLAGVDVHAALAGTTGQGPLPDEHPARALHYRLIEVCDAAATPHTTPAVLTRPPSRTVTAPTGTVTTRPPRPPAGPRR